MSTKQELLETIEIIKTNIVNRKYYFSMLQQTEYQKPLITQIECLDEIAGIVREHEQYKQIGTVSDFAELMKAKQEGRIAECTCGECKKYDTDDCPMVGYCDGCDCKVDLRFNETGFCKYAERSKPND